MHKGKVISYVRVSTVDQNDLRQIKAIEERSNIDKWFIEKVSAKDKGRKQLQAMLEYTREGDTVVINDFSRLARSTKDLLDLVELMKKKNVTLISLKENINTSTPQGKLMLTMIGAINEFERMNMLERQREGIAIAKKQGKYRGRKAIVIDDRFKALQIKYMNREINKTKFAKELGVSRTTLYKMLNEYEVSD
ncbi:recombinase family protein [Alkalicoccobacillus murimartini]|uniref:DNA invertase Pin-like site-specific DNA recombinase n=1 Tax=Alkalicoccobacillus murimartini TaxID=171685 RepID=A0ABT9YDX1_9BACI|nr:recombinase family protein [Alkalicoccobacillus murimartini]MDQ0205229.1 DNA invertase Pin-like site-specific DNA recombinase [Alkalicoccobacillus murimartini]